MKGEPDMERKVTIEDTPAEEPADEPDVKVEVTTPDDEDEEKS